jgi:hypothetical protein
MLFMLLPNDSRKPGHRPRRPAVPFEVGLATLMLALCVLYGLVFGHMIYVSLLEQVVSPHAHASGDGGLPHFHSPAEWALLFLPAVIAWSGTFSSLRYLVARARPRR